MSQVEERKTKKKRATKKAKSDIVINTENARGHLPLLQHLATLEPRIRLELLNGRGKFMWYAIPPKPEEQLLEFNNKIINKILGIESISDKKGLGVALNLMAKYFPEEFNFFPKTYTLPMDQELLESAMKASRRYFIAKPTLGSQGEGITLIRNLKDLNSFFKSPSDYVI
jgi:hypothetical protein